MQNNDYYKLIAKLIVAKSDIEYNVEIVKDIVNEYIKNLNEDSNNNIKTLEYEEILNNLDIYFVELINICTDSLKTLCMIRNEKEEFYHEK